MDPATLILKRTFPGDQGENVQAIEQLLSKDKAALASFRAKHCLPFTSFDNVPESSGEEDEEKPFLQTTYNVAPEKKAYRSPWTNRWYVTKDIGNGKEEVETYEKQIPDDEVDVRAIEKGANEVWDSYTQLYYGQEGIGSVYLKPRPSPKYGNGSFEGIFGIQKRTSTDEEINNKDGSIGSWDSVHYVSVEKPSKDSNECEYRVESAVLVSLNISTNGSKSTIGCALTKDTVKTCKIRAPHMIGSHLENLGTIMESVEMEFRSKMENFYVPKSVEVIQSVYRPQVGKSGTVHLAKNEEFATMATKMGVGGGASMIGEIADKAQTKKGDEDDENGDNVKSNPVLKAVEKNVKAKEEQAKDSNGTNDAGNAYTNLRAGLKSPVPNNSKPKVNTEPTPEFMNFRNKLKKASG